MTLVWTASGLVDGCECCVCCENSTLPDPLTASFIGGLLDGKTVQLFRSEEGPAWTTHGNFTPLCDGCVIQADAYPELRDCLTAFEYPTLIGFCFTMICDPKSNIWGFDILPYYSNLLLQCTPGVPLGTSMFTLLSCSPFHLTFSCPGGCVFPGPCLAYDSVAVTA